MQGVGKSAATIFGIACSFLLGVSISYFFPALNSRMVESQQVPGSVSAASPVHSENSLSYVAQSYFSVLHPCFPVDGSSGKLSIPANIKHIKVDVGISINAPNSGIWLNTIPDLMVFAFEPDPASLLRVKSGLNGFVGDHYRDSNYDKLVKSQPHFKFLDQKFVDKTWFGCNVALDEGPRSHFGIFHINDDPGTNSMNAADGSRAEIHTLASFKVPILPMSEFLALVPWDRFPVIDQVKIDAQGADLRILKGMGDYLQERVVCLSAEGGATGYALSHSEGDLAAYLTDRGFVHYQGETYRNKKFEHLWPTTDCFVLEL